jgi:outer membrane receptor protein involved in Fe transport
MKATRTVCLAAPRALLPACLLLGAGVAHAQQASANATTEQLARYDANKNGRLDPEELAKMQADDAAQNASGATDDKPLQLSPFQVTTARDTGYAAENTTAGSRLATPITDLAASITVITKQQMEDTASLDINDVFKYEAGTEGSSSYSPSITDRGTVKDTIAGYSFGNNGDTTTNAQSNRIRGLNAPDAAINNFSTNNRIPFDAYNVQSIEISRGPNSLLFGLGTPSGVVNTNAAQAVLNK